jgi:aminoglycoside phosphotransferase (APT) family kinase protein
MVEQSDIAHYLLSLGVVKPRSVIEEDLTVVDVSRRNSVFLATTRSGPTFVVKQAPADGAPGLAGEAAILRFLAGVPEVAPHVPKVAHADPTEGCLVLSTAPGARDWMDRRGRLSRIPARVLGRVLAALHGQTGGVPDRAMVMPGLLLPDPPFELVANLSDSARAVLAQIQGSAYMRGRLEELLRVDTSVALVHGDLRWENCLTLPAPAATRRTRLLLIDWELAGRGEPAFDVATVIASYLRVWLHSVPIADRVAMVHAGRPLRSLRPAIHAFWSAYTKSSSCPPPLSRVMELAAIPLLENAIERAQRQTSPSAQLMALLNLAGNVLEYPVDAAAGLLELRA